MVGWTREQKMVLSGVKMGNTYCDLFMYLASFSSCLFASSSKLTMGAAWMCCAEMSTMIRTASGFHRKNSGGSTAKRTNGTFRISRLGLWMEDLQASLWVGNSTAEAEDTLPELVRAGKKVEKASEEIYCPISV